MSFAHDPAAASGQHPSDSRPTRPPRTLPAPDHRSGEPRLAGGALLSWLERAFAPVEAAFARAVPERLNLVAEAGGLANTCLLIALATGVLLLFWYTPSVGGAHASVARMAEHPLSSGLLRTLHRTSSDLAMALVVLHAARLFLARRFTGPRWIAWVTGLLLLGLTWLVGWTGYWLVWDEAARQVALTTAGFLDALPIFVDPMSRSFLTDERLNSLLFFVVFFLHVLLPLGMAVAAWLHVARLARSRFLASRTMTLWTLGALVALSLLAPALPGQPARMAETPALVPLDGWFLAPVIAAERLSAGAAWALLIGLGAVLFSLPWTLARGRTRVAVVDEPTCHACMQCVQDCPYVAITMAPREQPGRTDLVARVDPARCVGCGLCNASCEPHAIKLPWDAPLSERRRVDAWLEQAPGTSAMIFACEGAGAGALPVDAATGRCEGLPEALVMVVPCTGWVHSLSIERALRRGASRVVIAGCPPGACRFREGDLLLTERLSGAREPALRGDKADPARVHCVDAPRIDVAFLRQALAQPAMPPRRSPGLVAACLALAAAWLALTFAVSRLPHRPAAAQQALLVISLRQAGDIVENCRDRSPEELAELPAHMRTPRVCSRERQPVRLRVEVDGQSLMDEAIPAAGLWSDGQSFAVKSLAVTPGTRQVSVTVARGEEKEEEDDSHEEDSSDDEDVRSFGEARPLEFVAGRRHVVDIDNGQLKWN